MKNSDLLIGLNRKRLIFNVTLNASLAIILLIVFFGLADYQDLMSPVIFQATGVVGFIFFAVVGGSHSKYLRKKDGGLILSKEGLEDQSSSISNGLIKWKEISQIRMMKGMSSKLLLVELRKPDQMMQKAKNKAVLRLMKQNMRVYKTPVVIDAKVLDCNFEELETTITDYFKRFAKK